MVSQQHAKPTMLLHLAYLLLLASSHEGVKMIRTIRFPAVPTHMGPEKTPVGPKSQLGQKKTPVGPKKPVGLGKNASWTPPNFEMPPYYPPKY